MIVMCMHVLRRFKAVLVVYSGNTLGNDKKG